MQWPPGEMWPLRRRIKNRHSGHYTELGHGAIDYSKILAAAKESHITSIFVEQEPPFDVIPALEAIKVDYEYLLKLNV
jgi:sugar phosphate isomerase/epimerase